MIKTKKKIKYKLFTNVKQTGNSCYNKLNRLLINNKIWKPVKKYVYVTLE